MNDLKYNKFILRKYVLLVGLGGVIFILIVGLLFLISYLTKKHFDEIVVPLENEISINTAGIHLLRTVITVTNQGNIKSFLSGINTQQSLSGIYSYTLVFNGVLPIHKYQERKNIFQDVSKEKYGVIRLYKSGYQELDRIVIDGNIFLKRERHFIESLY